MRIQMVQRGWMWRQALACFAVLALSVRAALPAGYMLDHDHDELVVRMCGGGEPSYMRLDLEAGSAEIVHGVPEPQSPKPAPHDEHAPCAFSLATASLAPTDIYVVTPPVRGPPEAVVLPPQTTHVLAHARAPLPARGPPLRA